MKNILHSLGIINKYADSKVKRLILMTSIAGFFWFVVESSFIYVIQGLLVSLQLLKPEMSFLPPFYPKEFSYNLALLITFGAIRSVAAFTKSYITGHASNLFSTFLRNKISYLSFSHVEIVNTSKVVDVFNDKASRAGYFVEQICGIFTTGTVILLLGIGCIYLSAPLFFLGLSIMALIALPVRLLDKKTILISHSHASSYGDINSIIINTLKNRFFLRIYNLVDKERLKVVDAIESFRRYNRLFVVFTSIKVGVPLLAGSVAIGVIAYIGSSLFKNDGMKLLSFIYLFIRFSQTFSDSLTYVSSMQVGHQSLIAMDDFISELEKEKPFEHADKTPLKDVPSTLSAKNVSFYYNDLQVIKNLSFEWKTGEVILIQGESGSGKSTLISLLLGYLVPSEGQVFVNETPVSSCRNDFTKWIAYVGPDPYLITGTIKENLNYGLDEASSFDYNEALSLAKVDFLNDDLLHNHKKLNETIPLSTGQKQRISIARAFYRNPKIMIFDEGTANLDATTEKHILNSLIKFKKDRITILISHKQNLENFADKIIKLEKI